MKLILESTSKLVEFNGVPARVWEGKTESGIACHAFITRVAVVNPSYELVCRDPVTHIKCLLCNRTSYNPVDVETRYCCYCHVFHGQVHAQFEAELQETRAPQAAAIESYPLRMVL